jgi:ribonuclease HI
MKNIVIKITLLLCALVFTSLGNCETTMPVRVRQPTLEHWLIPLPPPQHTNGPTPPPQPEKKQIFNENHVLRILQLNISGLRTKILELKKLLCEQRVHVALIQETMLPKNSSCHITGYTAYTCKCKTCQGLITLIHNDIDAEVSYETNEETDLQKVIIWCGEKKYEVFNVYNPPKFNLKLKPFPNPDLKSTIIAGDFNGHSPIWGYSSRNNTGHAIEELTNSTSLILLQNSQSPPTLLHRSNGSTSRPDLTLVSADIRHQCRVSVLDDIGSDHRPILIEISAPMTSKKYQLIPPSWNFKKANWPLYRHLVHKQFATIDMTQNTNLIYSKITSALLQSAKVAISRGHRKKYRPFWNRDLAKTVKERKKARRRAEEHPTPVNRTEYNRLSAKVKLLSTQAKKSTWIKKSSELDMRRSGNKAWRLITNLSGKKTKKNPAPLKVDSELIIKSSHKAETFNKYFSSVSKKQHRKPLDSAFKKLTKSMESRATVPIMCFEQDFSLSELKSALTKCKIGKAAGLDQIRNEMIFNLADQELSTILYFINKTWSEGKLPTDWKQANITPILKKDKPSNNVSSFRPISLTSNLGKIAERMINARLYWWLESTHQLSSHQAGFRKNKQTMDQLIRLTQEIGDAYEAELSVLAAFIDLKQAYDRVWRVGLLYKMQKMGVSGRMYEWLKGFFCNRTISTTFNGHRSKQRTLEEGLPQGSALSCTLFLIYINDLPDVITCRKALYADDLAIWVIGDHVSSLANNINKNLANIATYCQLWKLTINTEKTVYSIFSLRDVNERDIKIYINGDTLSYAEHPVYLGVTLDRELTLKQHVEELIEKTSKRLNIIKCLSSNKWGADQHVLRQLYTGYVRAVTDYSLPLLVIASKSLQKRLDRVQNQAVRFISGGMRSTPTDACEINTNIEPMTLRRERVAVETYERYLRMKSSEENKKMVSKWRPKHRLDKFSFVRYAKEASFKHHLPTDRKQITTINKQPPCHQVTTPLVKTELSDPTVNRNTLPTFLKSVCFETICSYPEDAIHVYTDGSAFKGTIKAGYGAFIKYPFTHPDDYPQIFGPCGKFCSNYTAEIIAVEKALRKVLVDFEDGIIPPDDIIVFSDSKSTLQSLENTSSLDVSTIRDLNDQLKSFYDVDVYFQWIPAHKDIPGNERADKLAKRGAAMTQPPISVSLQTVKQILRNNYKQEWLNKWATSKTGRSLFTHQPNHNPQDCIQQVKRSNQSLIFQLRTGHTPVNHHLNRLNPMREPCCRHCNHPSETVEHLLFVCHKLKALRQKLLPCNPTYENTLYASAKQLERTCIFAREAMGKQE